MSLTRKVKIEVAPAVFRVEVELSTRIPGMNAEVLEDTLLRALQVRVL